MVKNIESEKYGTITYKESNWIGTNEILVNGEKIDKIDKTSYVFSHEGEIVDIKVSGNFFSGATMQIGDEVYEVSPKTLWYEYALAIFNVVLIIVWGSSVALCSIVPVIGGLIGAAISGAFSLVAMFLMKRSKNPLIKLLIGFACIAVTFVICAILGIILAEFIAALFSSIN